MMIPDSLAKARAGRNALRQLRSQMRAGVASPAETERLLKAAEAGFDAIVGGDEPPLSSGRGFAPIVVDGGRP